MYDSIYNLSYFCTVFPLEESPDFALSYGYPCIFYICNCLK